MKTLLFIDTETTGKWVKGETYGRLCQPRMVQLAAMLVRPPDQILLTLNTLVRPQGFTIPPDATAIHHITTEQAQDQGLVLDHVLSLLSTMILVADAYVGHNITFDGLIVLNELHLAGKLAVCNILNEMPSYCTMKASTDVCKLPGLYGRYKWPKLSEAYQHFTGTPLTGAHDAMTDLRATLTIYNNLNSTPPTT